MYEDLIAKQHGQYGNVREQASLSEDFITSGDEGLGFAQARRLKRKLGRNGRRFMVGRSPYAVAGGTRYDYGGFGIAPVVIGAAGTAVSGGRVLGISFKKGSPRVFGGPLVRTVEMNRSKVERGDLSAIRNMDRARKTAKDKKAWQRIWDEMLPMWAYTPQGYALIRQLDPAFSGPAPSTAVPPILPPITIHPIEYPTTPGVPAVPPVAPVDAVGAPTPTPIWQWPIKPPIPGGEAPTASEEVAAAAQPEREVQEAGLAGFDVKGLMPLALIGVGALVLSTMAGGGKRRSRRRRR